jgi:hypothetical protein
MLCQVRADAVGGAVGYPQVEQFCDVSGFLAYMGKSGPLFACVGVEGVGCSGVRGRGVR